MRKFCAVILLLTGLVRSAMGAYYYVDTSGNDGTGDGSVGKPWRTLLYAVSKVPANQGHVIMMSAGTFVENGPIYVPAGVSIEGSGKDLTIIKANSAFYYYPDSPSYATDKFLICLVSGSYAVGNQYLKNFTIDGDAKKLHGGIFVNQRTSVLIDGIKVTGTDFSGVWLWDVKDSRMTNSDLINDSWGSSNYCVGALNLGNLERVEIDHCYINEDTGYGVKAIGPAPYNNLRYLKIHDCTVTVNPTGLWNGGSAPNIAIELWQVEPVGCEIFNSYIDNTISLVNENNTASSGVQTIRVHHNNLDMATRAKGSGYAIELTIHDAEIDHNYFNKGTYAIAHWAIAAYVMKNWSIHHNIFYGMQGNYPVDILRAQNAGLHNVNFYNNTIEFEGTQTVNLVGLYGGASDQVNLKNNLVINNNTAYSYYPNQLVHLENGATLSTLTVTNNLLYKLPLGSVSGTYANNLSSDPLIVKSGSRPDPYYTPGAGSPLIDAGTNVGFSFLGSAPDIGAYEYGGSPPANSLPQVSITAPANNASVTSGTSVTITANATDSDGTVSKVEFFSGATRLGEDLSSPYSFVWNAPGVGAYTLTAKATDNTGAVTTSSAINLTVVAPNIAPSVSITAPANNASVTSGTSVTITANATDGDGTVSKVEFFSGATRLGEDLSSPYSLVWNAPGVGAYTLTAKATDNTGAVTTSSAINLTVVAPNIAPSVSITAPANNASVTSGTSVTITANATDGDGTVSKVEFFSGATRLGEDLSSPYSFVWNAPGVGAYTLTAKATDNTGAVTTSAAIHLTVVAPNIAPSVSITAPANNASVTSGTSVTITANATDGDGTVSKVEFFSGATRLGEDLSSPYSFVWNAPGVGAYTLTAKATDNTGAVTTSSAINLTVVAPNIAPSVSITAPANNASVTSGTSVTITANATDGDGTVSKVEFFSGATRLGEDLSSPYSLVWNAPGVGAYTLTAKATDNTGAVTTSAAIHLTVVAPNIAPSVSITAPANNASVTSGTSVTITANATDSDGTVSKVEFFSGATRLGEDLSSPYSFVWNAPGVGAYTLTAKATDNTGAVTTSSAINLTVVAPNIAPSVSITAPANNASVTSGTSVTITANATDSDGTVSKVEFFSGATRLGEDLSSPYSLVWNAPGVGAYTLTAKATDNTGAVTTSAAINLNVVAPNVAPSVSITAPANNASVTSGTSVTITANATDSDGTVSKVEFFSGATRLGEDLSSPYSFVWNAPGVGAYTLTAKATDNTGAVTTSAAINLTVVASNIAPSVSITAPANHETFTEGIAVTITADASDTDGLVTKVEFFNGDIKLAEDPASPYGFIWDNMSAGNYIVTVRATDNAGESSSATIQFEVSPNTVPVVNAGADIAIRLPVDSLTLHGVAEDAEANITGYNWVQVSGPPVRESSTDVSGKSVHLSGLGAGTIVFEFSARDAGGLTGRDQVTIDVADAEELSVTFPRFFTPNGDGINDLWEWRNAEQLQEARVIIYNRFGQKVYENQSYHNDWDGKLNGKVLDDDAYYYIINIATRTIKGAVRIIKNQ